MKLTDKLNTAAAAEALGVSKATLLRWFRDGRIVEVSRDRNGWRIFTTADLSRIKRVMGLDA
ncbi:MAG: MerR family transcriptional regulator [Alphaproteobacteria bacterium]|nr:MerR family transcriptional regulator [Alphaproteobacteria bacterium]